MKSLEAYEEVYAMVASIPRGKVATYGQVSELAGLPRRARWVGYALRELPGGTGIPWHRVVNASGRISRRGRPDSEREQMALLTAEGVVFDSRGRVALDRFRWEPQGDPAR